MPDVPRYITHRTGLYVQVLDLAPVAELGPARTVATCGDSTSASTVALALNQAAEHDVDAMQALIARLDAAVCELLDVERTAAGITTPLDQLDSYGVIRAAVERQEARRG